MTGVAAALAEVGEFAFAQQCHEGRPTLVVATATAAAPRLRRLHDLWNSNDDLLDCLRASCHIPVLTQISLAPIFNRKRVN